MIDIRLGDCIEVMRGIPDGSVRTCVTSPPYFGLRDYGVDGQIGLEATPDAFVVKMVEVFREVRRCLSDDGTVWLNLGDSYAATGKSGGGDQGRRWEECGADTIGPRGGKWSPPPDGFKPKDLLGIPWRVAFALQADGWYLRSDIIWAKPNPMPESVRDRPTKAHEYVFLLAKNARYFYDAEAVREEAAYGRSSWSASGNDHYKASCGTSANAPRRGAHTVTPGNGGSRNARSVWTITPRPFKGAHFATFPPELAERCIKAGSSERGKCPECGAAWVRVVERTRYEPEVVDVGVRNVDASRADKTRKLSGSEYNKSVRVVGERWRPTCDHGHEPVPDVVLDPFAGAGTVGLVCQRLGRSHIGAELNPAYRDMAIARIKAESSPLLDVVA